MNCLDRRFFLAGGTSDVGERVANGIVKHYGKESLTCLVRNTSNASVLANLGVRLVIGDVTAPATFQSELNAETIYIDMTHPKHYHKSIDVVKNASVNRAFFVTTTGIFSQYRSAAAIYIEGEERIKKSGLIYTIIRPSMIYGTEKDRNMTKLLRYLNKWPIFPIFGQGNHLMQPVYVQDLADGILASIFFEEVSRNKEYNLCGPVALSYLEIVKCCMRTLDRNVTFLFIPQKLAEMIAAVGENIPGFPITLEQVRRLSEDKCFDISLAVQDLSFSPRPFTEGIQLEVWGANKISAQNETV